MRAGSISPLAAVEGFVQIGQAKGKRLAGGPCRLFFLGLDGPELFDRLLRGAQDRFGLLGESAAALGLQLELVPQGREFFNQIDEPEVADWLSLSGQNARSEAASLSDSAETDLANRGSGRSRRRRRLGSFMGCLPVTPKLAREAAHGRAASGDRSRGNRSSRHRFRS